MVAIFKNDYHLRLFPFIRKCASKYRAIYNITGKQSFNMRALTLSGPGDLFSGKDVTTRRTSSHVTGFKLNCLPGAQLVSASDESS